VTVEEVRHARHDHAQQQNARVVVDAGACYRTISRRDACTWNLRDTHMVTALEALVAHLGRQTPARKAAVWAHDSWMDDVRNPELERAIEPTSAWDAGEPPETVPFAD
jgi:erythromycin esterase-like protein